MSHVLVVAETESGRLAAATARCVSCARALDPEGIDIVVFAGDDAVVAESAASLTGVDRVLHVRTPPEAVSLAAAVAPEIARLAAGYSHVLGPATTFGKDVMPRAAALLGVMQVSDVMQVDGAYRFKRPIYAGNAIVTVETDPDRIVVATARPASFAAAPAGGTAVIERYDYPAGMPLHTRYVGVDRGAAAQRDLGTADRVVAGGRGVATAENFHSLETLAERLGAAVGASRAAVDAGFAPNDLQIGQTGKIIAPELYIAVGISGAIQHLTGIRDAGLIVAINSDPDAPIFDVADIGLVADLNDAVPALLSALGAPGNRRAD